MIANENTKFVISVVTSCSSNACPPLLILNNSKDRSVPPITDATIMIILLLSDMVQRKKRMR